MGRCVKHGIVGESVTPVVLTRADWWSSGDMRPLTHCRSDRLGTRGDTLSFRFLS